MLTPEEFLNHLNNVKETTHPSGNNNENPVQTLNDILISHTANCIDIANAVHEICKNKEHYLVLSRFSIKNKSMGHVYCIYKDKNYRVFRFDLKTKYGKIKEYTCNLGEVIYCEELALKAAFTNLLGECSSFNSILTKKEMQQWDNLVRKKVKQKELMKLFVDSFTERIINFNIYLNTKFDYGKLINNKKIIEFDNFEDYITISPKNFFKYKIGVCWDFAEFEGTIFSEWMNLTSNKLMNNEFSMYYIEHKDKKGIYPTHTWLAYNYNDKIYLFESSWQKYQGIRCFLSEKEMINFYSSKLLYENEKILDGPFIFKYNLIGKYGLIPEDYMDYIWNNGKLIQYCSINFL